MKNIFRLALLKREDYFIPEVSFLFLKHKFRSIKYKPIVFYWKDVFYEYFLKNNMKFKIKNLKSGMDKVSCDYIDNFIKLFSYINKPYFGNPWTKEDKRLKKECKEFEKTFKQPFRDILTINPFYYSQIYGLKDLYNKILENINGKIIIDGGALNGDTALMFHHYFPKSQIFAYEPLSKNYEIMEKFLAIDNCNNKIIPVKKGLGEKEGTANIQFNYTEIAQITTLDIEFKNSTPIGLIKLDTEGFETKIINGAKNIIKRDKPVIVTAIYHTPQDFFELKDKLKSINPDYKFMIRRSEPIIPMADLVLIAY